MAEVKKMITPTPTASSRPCGFVSPDKGNAPTITPVPKAESVCTDASGTKAPATPA
ncbi:hypothetical protein [Streptomyces hiroshimensis]|uniref:Uncharacterized protein n=1 Tax=Streptomyces hiroshimensis TaxID=66424 RepID=A0ABQ2YJS3_9ACTN|nr:hypothetical protein [Streptomyces hiroshimensis]GGX86688.1 hypothetical protein GCM10010324_35240 [Streptomyces hiroshimensis]